MTLRPDQLKAISKVISAQPGFYEYIAAGENDEKYFLVSHFLGSIHVSVVDVNEISGNVIGIFYLDLSNEDLLNKIRDCIESEGL